MGAAGSSSVKPVVPEDVLGWHGTRGTVHTPTSAAALLLRPRGPRMMRARPGTPHTSTAGHHRVTQEDQPLPGLQLQFSPLHPTSALASDPHGVQPADGCRRCPRSPLASRTSPVGTALPPAPLCCTAEPGRLSFCPWPGRGLVVLCFCSCCKLTAKVSLYTEYLQILIYICISFCYSIFICSGSTNAVFFLFTDATGQENDGGFVWPVGFVCVTVEDAGLY